MKDRTILKTGIIGTAIMIVCCFTPFLVILLGIFGLSAWLGWLDFILLPALVVFVAIAFYGFYRQKKACIPHSKNNSILQDQD